MMRSDITSFRVMVDVIKERQRQDEKWGALRDLSPEKWMMILIEEVGEFAKAVLDKEGSNIRTELVQVAAVALAMLENCDRSGWSE